VVSIYLEVVSERLASFIRLKKPQRLQLYISSLSRKAKMVASDQYSLTPHFGITTATIFGGDIVEYRNKSRTQYEWYLWCDREEIKSRL
jgi:hypothetical protein